MPRPKTLSQNLDQLMEEYTSMLEQKVAKQTAQLQAELEELQAEKAKSEAVLISIGAGVVATDRKGVIERINKGFTRITGWSEADVLNRQLDEVMPLEDELGNRIAFKERPAFKALTARTKTVFESEGYYLRKDGSRFPADITTSPILLQDKVVGAVSSFIDITERKQAERQKDDFIAIASHELKTPVTSIKALVQIMQRRFKKSGNTEGLDLTSRTDAQITKLINLINSLLDITRMDSGRLELHLEKFSLDDLVRETVTSLQLTTDRHQIKLEGEVGARVWADKHRIEQVIVNYISNAIKYSPHSEKIIIRLNADRERAVVAVQDFGVGLPPERQEQVFQRFFRVSGTKRETYPGLGLGLYISAEIIKHEGGEVWVDSKEGEGSTFYFSLPLRSPQKKIQKNDLAEVEAQHA